jgi:hypothetical protein
MSCAQDDHVNRFRVFSSASSSLRCRRTTSFTTPHKQRYPISFFPRVTSCTTPQPYLVSFLAQPRVPRHNATSSLSSRNLVYHATTLPPLFPRATSCTTPQRYLLSFLAQPRVPRHNATSSLSSRDALGIQSCFALAS